LDSVAFDLDMTLVDSRPVARRVLSRLVAEHRHDVDIETLMGRYGVPAAQWLPLAVDRVQYRSLQMQEASSARSMPGAAAAIDAVRIAGMRVVVVTGTSAGLAREMLRAAGLRIDRLLCDVWAVEKANPLLTESCWAYVGDHADDMEAARHAGCLAIGVATGTSRPMGADVELRDLTMLPPWLAEHAPQPNDQLIRTVLCSRHRSWTKRVIRR